MQVCIGAPPEAEHAIVQQGLLAIAGINHRLHEMEIYGAISGLRGTELPILERKFSILENTLDPDAQEERFDRVVTLANLPTSMHIAAAGGVNVKKLLKVRESAECVEFESRAATP